MTNPYDVEFCQDCHRPKARSASDAAIGFCDKSRAYRDPEADKDCALFKEARLKRLVPNGLRNQRDDAPLERQSNFPEEGVSVSQVFIMYKEGDIPIPETHPFHHIGRKLKEIPQTYSGGPIAILRRAP